MEASRNRIKFGAEVVICGLVGALTAHTCSSNNDEVTQAMGEKSSSAAPKPFDGQRRARQMADQESVETSPPEPTTFEEIQNDQALKVAKCIEGTASRDGLDVVCEDESIIMALPDTPSDHINITKLSCFSYDGEGYPNAVSYPYIGHTYDGDDVIFASLSSETPLGRYMKSVLPALPDSSVGTSEYTMVAETQAALAPEIEPLCLASLEQLVDTDSEQNIKANDLSRAMGVVSEFLNANGITHTVPGGDERFFNSSSHDAEIRFSNKARIPYSCSVYVAYDAFLTCHPAYPGHFIEGVYTPNDKSMGDAYIDQGCAFGASISDLKDFAEAAKGVWECNTGYIFTE